MARSSGTTAPSLDLDEVLAELEALGSEQTRRIYARHGVSPPLFGVKFGDLARLFKRIGRNHELALSLWATGNHDARVLACKLAEPERITVAQSNAWVRTCDNYVLMEAVAAAIADAPIAKSRAANWRDRTGEWVASAGWCIVAHLATRGDLLSDSECRALLGQIGREIHTRPNRVRHEMNLALIAIGTRGGALEREAVRVATKIGPVTVDHGTTGCTTPDAVGYLAKVAQRRKG
ncbi:MAG TPA: DNA alkylation repair protein [Acidimicrobiia bacterium]|nr:DNA alkylation repair protein [Acidimicrobiia bacterium]